MYIHEENYHPLKDSEEILPILFDRLGPSSVVDVGCGIGTFLDTAQKLGATKVTGLDGDWVDQELLSKHIDPEAFIPCDLAKPLSGSLSRYDMAFCLEVAEHLPEAAADTLVESLASLSDVVLFSAAIPGQGGQNHINEQWPDYWAERFAKREYIFADVIRPLIWDNESVSWWYRQNTFLVVKQEKVGVLDSFSENWSVSREGPLRLVHPALFEERSSNLEARLDKVFTGKLKARSYLYLWGKSLIKEDEPVSKR